MPNHDSEMQAGEVPDLPRPITDISVQKKNKTRYSLYSDGSFLVGVSEQTLTTLNLRKGSLLTLDLYNQIQKAEEYQGAKDYCLRLLGRRDHSTKELIDKGLRKGLDKKTLQEVTCELEEKGYIDNLEFARRYTKEKYHINNWGERKIQTHLFKKGIPRSHINLVLNEIMSDEASYKTMEKLIKKKAARFSRAEPATRKEKIYRYLAGRGFSPRMIFKHIDHFLNLVE